MIYRALGKRLVDVLVAAILLLLLWPVLLVVWVIVRWKLGKPALFRQERPGLAGRPFNMVKFRTMTDARDANGHLMPDSVRLTKLGRFLRATSLDELPELWNVLKGDMSLVGPRPLRMEYLPLYTPEENRRHDVRPGITGWAQINGRNALSWEQRFTLDLEYVRRLSPLFDFMILLKTAGKVVKRDGISAEGHATMPSLTVWRKKS